LEKSQISPAEALAEKVDVEPIPDLRREVDNSHGFFRKIQGCLGIKQIPVSHLIKECRP